MIRAALIGIWVACAVLCFFLMAFAEEVSVKFQWNASSGPVAGYKLYQGTQSGNYSKSTVIPGQVTTGSMSMDVAASRYVAATAYDASGHESAFSNEILCHPIVTSCEAGGSITPGGSFFVQNGNNVQFTITPKAGSYVNNVVVNGASAGPVSAYLLSQVTTRTTISVDTEALPKVVTYDLAMVVPAAANDPIVVELPSTGAVEYELRAFSFERRAYQAFGASTLLTRQITLSKAGHYLVEYRGCTGTGTGRSCSAWVPSSDSQYGPKTRKEDGSLITKGWWVYQYTRAPGPVIIQ